MAEYIVASSKPWHREEFESYADSLPGQWFYVENQRELEDLLSRTEPRYIFFLHWNWRVRTSIWSTYECVCFHMTDVPYGRGGSPLQNLILAGHRETRLSALRMVEEMDAGPVYGKRPLSLAGSASEIFRRAGQLSFNMIAWMVEAEPDPEPQTGRPTVFHRRTPEQSELPGNVSLEQLYDYIRMLDAPTYPKAFVRYGDLVLEFTDAHQESDKVVSAKVEIRRASISGDGNDDNH